MRQYQLFYFMCRMLVRRTLKTMGGMKNGRTCEMLGYSPQQLREHLERLFKPGMTWRNHGQGPGKWEVDHVIPVS
jgi:predicted ArsR family transcriptional regulator